MLTVTLQAKTKTMYMQCHMTASIYHACIDLLTQIVPARLSEVAHTSCMPHLIVSKRHDQAAAEQRSIAKFGSKGNNHMCNANSKAKAEEVTGPQGQHRSQG